MKIKRRGEVVIELTAYEAEEFRRFLYEYTCGNPFSEYTETLNEMYNKLADI